MIYRFCMKVLSFENTRGHSVPAGREGFRAPPMVGAARVGCGVVQAALGMAEAISTGILPPADQCPLAEQLFAFDELRVPEEIFESFDEPLDAVVTERRIILEESAPL